MTALSLKLDTPQLAQKYEERSADRQFRHGRQLIADLGIRAGEHVIDIGSGTGLLAAHVANLVGTSGSVLGIDPLPLRIEIAKRKTKPGLTFQVGNAYALDQYPSEHFDVVYLNSVFHWLPEKHEPLKQILRILKPNGRLGITTGSKDHQGALQLVKKKVLEQKVYSQYPDPLSGRPFNVGTLELAQLLEETGFELSKIELQDNVQFQPTPDAAIEFSEASSFGNFLGHLPESLRERAAQDIKKELESLVTPEGIRLENKRILAIARKPSSE